MFTPFIRPQYSHSPAKIRSTKFVAFTLPTASSSSFSVCLLSLRPIYIHVTIVEKFHSKRFCFCSLSVARGNQAMSLSQGQRTINQQFFHRIIQKRNRTCGSFRFKGITIIMQPLRFQRALRKLPYRKRQARQASCG